AAAEVLGWPVVVKAAAGTAGRALAVVGEGDDLPGTVEAVRRAAGAASGDPTVFLEPWVEPVRHIEVQIFGDVTGRVVHLFERDCSLQRRYEALVVEAPAPRLAQPLRERLHAAAIAVGEAAGYVGAGSVAFLVAGDRLWFLSLSPRLSAGHGVTEALLGLDLVRMQLAAAEGRPLPVEARHCSPSGHAVAAHLWAEDPAAGYRPDAGLLRRLEIPAGSGLRVEAGAAAGSVVGREPGGRLATLVTHAGSRPEAVRRLAMALEGARIHGLRTNRDQLAAALRHPDFVTADVDTGFLHRHHDELCRSRGGPAAVRLHAVAAALTGLAGDDRSRRETVAFAAPGGGRVEVAYRIDGRGTLAEVAVDGEIVAGLRVDGLDPAGVDLEVDGIRRRVAVTRAGVVVDCDSRLGHTELVELDPSAAAG
ncbi:MAG TPA: acetyl/propionyl-CoA carboxylase subunit alpha, partial [Acidimicrobiia bacterium]|nr:acetyl/propionyl-CoA carboxylase subunit alpha [Acidimicrobiia bacterium]